MTHRKVFQIGPITIYADYPSAANMACRLRVGGDPFYYLVLSEIEQLKEACEYVIENIEATRKEEGDDV